MDLRTKVTLTKNQKKIVKWRKLWHNDPVLNKIYGEDMEIIGPESLEDDFQKIDAIQIRRKLEPGEVPWKEDPIRMSGAEVVQPSFNWKDSEEDEDTTVYTKSSDIFHGVRGMG